MKKQPSYPPTEDTESQDKRKRSRSRQLQPETRNTLSQPTPPPPGPPPPAQPPPEAQRPPPPQAVPPPAPPASSAPEADEVPDELVDEMRRIMQAGMTRNLPEAAINKALKQIISRDRASLLEEYKEKVKTFEQRFIAASMELKRLRAAKAENGASASAAAQPPAEPVAPSAPAPQRPRGYAPNFQRSTVVCRKPVEPKTPKAPPTGRIALVFTDVQGSTKLWDAEPTAMRQGLMTHNKLMRKLIEKKEGYEVKTEGDSFMVAFNDTLNALQWCLAVQVALVKCDWPIALLEHDDARKEYDSDGLVVFHGLRVRMGVHVGEPLTDLDPTTQRMDYFGGFVNASARISHLGRGGEVIVSEDVYKEVHTKEPNAVFLSMGKQKLRGLSYSLTCYTCQPTALRGRTFPTQARTSAATSFLQWAEQEVNKHQQAIALLEAASKAADEAGVSQELLERHDSTSPRVPKAMETPRRGERTSEHPTTVFTEIAAARQLWTSNPSLFAQALVVHNTAVRHALEVHHGSEVWSHAGSFVLAFTSALSAYMFCVRLQEALVQLPWPSELLVIPGCDQVRSKARNMEGESGLLWKGLRVKMAIVAGGEVSREGGPRPLVPLVNGVSFFDLAHGGECLISRDAYTDLKPVLLPGSNVYETAVINALTQLKQRCPRVVGDDAIYQMLPKSLAGRLQQLSGSAEGEQKLADAWREQREQHASRANEIMRAVQMIEHDNEHIDAERPAPTGKVTLVHTGLSDTLVLWENHTEDMHEALILHNREVRKTLKEFDGYEVKKTQDGEGFVLAFSSPHKAMNCCLVLQERLLALPWPSSIVTYTSDPMYPTASAGKSAADKPLWRGLRARMSIHTGSPYCAQDPQTRRMDYFGVMLEQALSIFGMARGGEILASHASLSEVENALASLGSPAVTPLGATELRGTVTPVNIFRVLPASLKGRTFPPWKDGRRSSVVLTINGWWSGEEARKQEEAKPMGQPMNTREGIERCIALLVPLFEQKASDVQRLESLLATMTGTTRNVLSSVCLNINQEIQSSEEALDILHFVLQTAGDDLNHMELATDEYRQERDEDEWLLETVREYTLPTVPKGRPSSATSRPKPQPKSEDDDDDDDLGNESFNSPERLMQLLQDMQNSAHHRSRGARNKSLAQLYALHRTTRFYFSLIRLFLSSTLNAKNDNQTHSAAGGQKMGVEEFMTSWVKWTSAFRDDLFVEERQVKKKPREEFSEQIVLAIDNDLDEQRLQDDATMLVGSVIGHYCRHFNTLKRLFLKHMQMEAVNSMNMPKYGRNSPSRLSNDGPPSAIRRESSLPASLLRTPTPTPSFSLAGTVPPVMMGGPASRTLAPLAGGKGPLKLVPRTSASSVSSNGGSLSNPPSASSLGASSTVDSARSEASNEDDPKISPSLSGQRVKALARPPSPLTTVANGEGGAVVIPRLTSLASRSGARDKRPLAPPSL